MDSEYVDTVQVCCSNNAEEFERRLNQVLGDLRSTGHVVENVQFSTCEYGLGVMFTALVMFREC